MQALTIRETTLETQAATIPELYGELANRRRTERSLRTAGAPTVLGPSASDPVSTLWQTMADTHSPTNRRGSAVPSTSASSAASATVEASDGTLYAPAVPGKKDDAEKTRLRREMYDRQSDDRGNFKAGACAKYDSTKMLEQTRCRHPFDQLKWGANGKSIYASCGACGLKTCVMYNRSEAFVSDVEDDVNDVHVVQLAPGLVMMDTGCRAAVGGTSWHKNLQKCLKGLGRTFYQKEQLEYFQFGPGEPITSTRRWHYQVGVHRELSISEVPAECPGHPCLSLLEYDKNPRAVFQLALVQEMSDEDVPSDHSSDNELEGLLRRTSAKTEDVDEVGDIELASSSSDDESSHVWTPEAEQSDEETEEEQLEEQGVFVTAVQEDNPRRHGGRKRQEG